VLASQNSPLELSKSVRKPLTSTSTTRPLSAGHRPAKCPIQVNLREKALAHYLIYFRPNQTVN